MRSLFRLTGVVVASLALNGCGLLIGHALRESSRKTQEESQVVASLGRYRNLVVERAPERIAELFAEDCELSHNGEKPIVGSSQVAAFFKSFTGYQIRQYELKALSTTVDKEVAQQSGTYAQTVVAPDGNTIVAAGSFEAAWRHQADGRWLLTRMHTTSPAKPGG